MALILHLTTLLNMVELSAVSAVASEANGCTTVGTDIVWHRPSVSGR